MKQCIKCKEWKSYKEFHRCKTTKDGYKSVCKICRKEYYKQNIEKTKEYYKKNKEKIKEYKKQDKVKKYQKEWYKNNKDKVKKYQKEYYKQNIENHKKQMRQNRNSSVSYDLNIKEEIELYEKVKKSKNNNIECKCTYCGDWFEPNQQELRSRLKAIYGDLKGECRLYCSNNCKINCPSYNQKLYFKNQTTATSREVQPELRQMVFERDNYTCQKCNIHRDNLEVGIHCHHREGILWDPIESADMDMCITLCEDCHKEAHKIDGCGYNDLKCV